MTQDKTIEELIEAGEKATQGEWRCHTREEDEYINAIGDVYLPSPHEGGFSIHRKCNPVNNAYYITQAANAREAIKAQHQELIKLREEKRKNAWEDMIFSGHKHTLQEDIETLSERLLKAEHEHGFMLMYPAHLQALLYNLKKAVEYCERNGIISFGKEALEKTGENE